MELKCFSLSLLLANYQVLSPGPAGRQVGSHKRLRFLRFLELKLKLRFLRFLELKLKLRLLKLRGKWFGGGVAKLGRSGRESMIPMLLALQPARSRRFRNGRTSFQKVSKVFQSGIK